MPEAQNENQVKMHHIRVIDGSESVTIKYVKSCLSAYDNEVISGESALEDIREAIQWQREHKRKG